MRLFFFWHSLVARLVGTSYSEGKGSLSLLCFTDARCVQTSAGPELASSADGSKG